MAGEFLRIRLALLLLASLVAAGCANPGDDGSLDSPDGGAAPPAMLSKQEARNALEESLRTMPELFGVDMEIVSGEGERVTLRGHFDNASDITYLELSGDLGDFLGDSGGQAARGFAGESLTIYTTPEGTVFLANNSAFAFPPTNASGRGDANGFPDPSARAEEFAIDSDELLETLGGAGVNVTSVTPRVYRGQPAVELGLEHERAGNVTVESKVILFLQPSRLAYVETSVPAESDGAASPFAGGIMKGDFLYGDEVTLEPSQAAQRSLGLAYKSDLSPFAYPTPENITWTFLNSKGIALDEVEVQVKDTQGDVRSSDPSALPTLMAMKLSEGAASGGGVTLAFDDADGDGLVSKGDTLTIRTEGDEEMPTVMLYDTVTSTYVVPGPGILAVLAAAAALAAVRARRK